ncbi:MAG: hypothetical protein ACT4QA_20550 [Panacagrimonas sp.]
MNKILCLVCCVVTSAQAAVYRCEERGRDVTRYQNHSCPGGTFQQELRIATPPPPEFFIQQPVTEIRTRTPVRVVPLVDEGAPLESASSDQADPDRP